MRTLVLYLNTYRLEPKLGAKYAGQIRPAIVDALGLPEGTAWPSSSTIVKALRAIKKEV